MIPFDHFSMFSNSLQELQKALDGSFQQLTMGGRCLVICQSTIDRSLGDLTNRVANPTFSNSLHVVIGLWLRRNDT